MSSGHRTLSRDEAKRFYDRFGARQDHQGWYEDAALELLIEHGRFGTARRVVELGCGTGKLAHRLLERELAPDASYLGFDLSSTMVELSRERLIDYGDRARVELTDGRLALDLEDASGDRFVSTYVLDLLSDADIERALGEAWRVLEPHGLLCVASLTPGVTVFSSLVSRVWSTIHRLRPALVGGCRPIRLEPRLPVGLWTRLAAKTVVARGLTSEVVIYERRSRADDNGR